MGEYPHPREDVVDFLVSVIYNVKIPGVRVRSLYQLIRIPA